MKLGFLSFILVQLSTWSPLPTEGFTWRKQPASASGIQGQSVSITWIIELAAETWDNVRVNQEVPGEVSKKPMIRLRKTTGRSVYADYNSRDADLNLTASLNGSLLTSVFTMKNLNRSTDEHLYSLSIVYRTDVGDIESRGSRDLKLTVLVPPTITGPNPKTVTVNESQPAQLECTVSGNPTPQVNWTRNGVLVGTGVYTTPNVGVNDDKTCYTCIAYNGVLDAKSANVCLNVQYKPRNATVLSDKSTVCQGDKVTLTCTSGPANPAANSYEFYKNGGLVGTSASNVYEATATAGLPAVNKFVCVPRNILGRSLENASVEVAAKVAPVIVTSPSSESLLKGSTLTLFCNASGVPAPNITWTKVGGSIAGVTNTERYTIASVTRGDEGTYRCTASNGDECSNATAEANVVVNYPPENTLISINKSDNTFLKGDTVKLSCASTSKPQLCNVTFYHGNTAIQSYYGKTCAGGVAASHVIQSIDGCNLEEYSCKAENQYGQQEAKVHLTVNVPATIAISPAVDQVLLEGDALQLNCSATGCPTPNITWTKTGVSLASGNGFFLSHSISSISKSGTGRYKCKVDNGVVGSPLERTIYVNVMITYKPHLTNLTSTRSRACLNDHDPVTLQCTTTANPPADEYRFYLNDQLVHTSMSGVYQLNVPQAGNNTYKCEPKNTVGTGQNASATIDIKGSPVIVNTTPSQEVREGSRHTLYCNVQAQGEYINVTWHKVGSGQVSSNAVYDIPYVSLDDSGSYECRARNVDECEVKSTMIKIIVISAPNISSIMVTEGGLAVTWSNLLLPHNKMATCLIHARESFHGDGTNWVTSSNTSHGSSISCSVSGLQPFTLYRIQYALHIHLNYVNGTIYIGTTAKDPNSNKLRCYPGQPTTVFVAVIAVAVAVIVILVLVIIWMRCKGMQKNKRINRKNLNKTVPLANAPSFGTEPVYQNEGFISRQTERDGLGDMSLYEQVQNRGLVIHEDVGGATSFPMQTFPGRPERGGGATTSGNQVQSQFEEPSYLSVDLREIEAARRVHVSQGSYGNVMDFKRRSDNSTGASPQDQNPYQELQSENRSRQYQSLQNMQRPAFDV